MISRELKVILVFNDFAISVREMPSRGRSLSSLTVGLLAL